MTTLSSGSAVARRAPHSRVLSVCGGKPRGLGADAADTDDQRSRLRQVHDVAVVAGFLPLTAKLLREVDVQPAREGEHERHHMRADVVVVDLEEIGDLHRMRDQLRIVIAGGGRGLRGLEPAQPRRSRQQVGGDYAKSRIGMRDHLSRMRMIFRNDDLELG